ncbi:MAG: C15orf41 family protein [Methanomassiliicoccales archaeon]
MKYEDYKAIYDGLNSPRDIAYMADKMGMDEEFLNVVYTQKTVRTITKSFYKVKKHSRRILKDWERGRSMLELAEDWNFSPILTGLFIFQESDRSKKYFWKCVRDPGSIEDERLKREIEEITAADYVYSPWASEKQYQRGLWGERLLSDWLDEQGHCYKTEEDLRGEYPKTPDCLFEEPVELNGWSINWIESKASFGDNVEIKKNVKKQLLPYVDLFGEGLVVYWFGYIDDFRAPKGICIADDSLLNWKCNKE